MRRLLRALPVLSLLVVGCQYLGEPERSRVYGLNDIFYLTDNQLETLEKRAIAGDANAAVRLEEFYSMFLGDSAESVRWLRLGAELGNLNAQTNLSTMLMPNPRSEAEAIAWLTKAANGGDKFAQQQLHRLSAESIAAANRSANISDADLDDIANVSFDAWQRQVKFNVTRGIVYIVGDDGSRVNVERSTAFD